MGKEILMDREYVVMEYDPDMKYIFMKWFKNIDEEDFMKVLDETFQLQESLEFKGVVIDIRLNRHLGRGASEYVAKKYNEFIERHGPYKQAFVVSDDVFSKFRSDVYNSQLGQIVPENMVAIKYFDDPNEALIWIIE